MGRLAAWGQAGAAKVHWGTMSLPFAPVASLGAGPLVLALMAVLAYTVAALPAQQAPRLPAPALVAGWLLHAVLLALDIGGWGRGEPGARLGFGPVLSLTVWLVLAVHTVESRFVPLPGVRRVLAINGALVVLLAWAFPGEVRPSISALAPVHWVLGVASYALFGAAVLHATMLDAAERALRASMAPSSGLIGAGAAPRLASAGASAGAAAAGRGPMGLPLLRLERLTFRFVEVGFVVLTAALLFGAATVERWRWDHKTVFSLLGWAVFAALLAGRHWRGWRGKRATRWLYVGAALLLLAYVGSRFVFEVVLGRAVV